MLVRSPDRIAPALKPLGISKVEHAVGDITDLPAIKKALEGCDAVVHTANVYTFDSRRWAEMLDVNPRGTSYVLGAAHERGLDPIIHVSSNAALMPTDRVLDSDSPLGNPPGAYSQSKVAAERIARDLQDKGAPVKIVNPTGLLGPHDPHLGDFMTIMRDILAGRMPFVMSGTTPMVDVRDVAAIFAALMKPGLGPRRYMASGAYTTLPELVGEASRLSGRKIRSFVLPSKPLLAVGKVADTISRTLKVRLPVSFEGPWFMVHAAKVDASAVERDLGVRFRPKSETLGDVFRWLATSGHVSPEHAGKLLS
jgi:nucleoside-diphosphate-sugar epimerase